MTGGHLLLDPGVHPLGARRPSRLKRSREFVLSLETSVVCTHRPPAGLGDGDDGAVGCTDQPLASLGAGQAVG